MALIEAERTARGSGGRETALRDWVRALEATARIPVQRQRTLHAVIAELAETQGDAPALLSAGESLTYAELAARANRFARWALTQNLAKGEIVCLMMPNRPEYLTIWLGLTGVGVVVSLVNTNLRGASLAHCIDLVAPAHVIVAAELTEHFRSAAAELKSAPKIWSHGGDEFERIDRAVEELSSKRLSAPERRAVTIADRALLIYTSGTTGLPKAASVSHQRLLQWSFWFAGLMNTGPGDRMYDCLPLYHSVGGVVATGSVLVRGGSVVIREKFSAQHFWDDVAAWDCTLVQYIGELARYLLNAPHRPRERAHRIRLCCGNGLQADVWEKFQARFKIPRIFEFYAATEGNVSLYNVEGKVGAIGRIPPFLTHRFPLALVKFDAAAGAPARDPESDFCIPCAAGEAGESLGRIRDGSAHPGGEFEGYTSAADTQGKILRDVFARGDAWYRTGDLMRRDAGGFFYFVDRVGDTFRWKGENFATAEVAAAIAAFPGIAEANVYGVRVPGSEGAAGMAAVVVDGVLDLPEFRAHLARRLPPYARLLFVRIVKELPVTSTFKHLKNDLKREGYDPVLGDAVYFDDPRRQAFVPLSRALYRRVQIGKVRLPGLLRHENPLQPSFN
jgi:fatty-acyl-CoA synthase